jgi:hypothetical protein
LTNIMKISGDDERIVTGVVYSPLEIDTDGEAMTPDDLREMAYNFLSEGRVDKIDLAHNFEPIDGCRVIESFIARDNDPDYPVGSWVLTVKVDNDEVWGLIKKGVINGFSFAGQAVPKGLRDIPIKHPIKSVGTTEISTADGPLPRHDHNLTLLYDEDGRIIPTKTEISMGHFHPVEGATATETAYDHGHRLEI